MEIRGARREELPHIVELLADDPLGARREDAGPPLPPEYEQAFNELTAQPGNEILVAVEAGDVVGCLQLTLVPGISRKGAKRAFIEGVRVSRSYRSKGVGERMVRAAIERARDAGCALVQLTSDASRKDAHRFWERLGFTPSHVGFKMEIGGEGPTSPSTPDSTLQKN